MIYFSETFKTDSSSDMAPAPVFRDRPKTRMPIKSPAYATTRGNVSL